MWRLLIILFLFPQQEQPKKIIKAESINYKLDYLMQRMDSINLKVDSLVIDSIKL